MNPDKLNAQQITFDDVFTALEKNNQNTGGAYMRGMIRFVSRSEGLLKTTDDIGNIVIKNLSNGIPLLIKDIAEIKIGNAIRYGAMTYNGEREVAGAVVMMLKGANSNVVIENIKDKIKSIQQTMPKGLVIEAVFG